jgi:hypothetical protein
MHEWTRQVVWSVNKEDSLKSFFDALEPLIGGEKVSMVSKAEIRVVDSW